MFKRFLLSVYGIILFQTLFSQIPSGYYDSATGTGYTLKTQLYNIIKGHTELSYTPGLWDAYYTTDVDVYYENDGSVLDIYSENPAGTDPYNFELGTDQDDGSNVPEGEHYNREHSFPRNWFGGEVAPMNTDIFHIYPTDKVVNNERSNWPYGEVNTPTWTSANGSKKGPCSYPGYTGTVFEPIDEFKGDLARTYFYMATRYENVIATWPGSDMLDGSNDQCFTSWALNMLLDWHYNDPVSQKEIDRNNEIYDNYQNNRNPFIDHPEYVSQIWGGGGNSLPSISGIAFNPAEPESTESVTVTAAITDSDGSITTAYVKWGTASETYSNSVNMSNSRGNYSGTIPAQTNGTHVYFIISATDNSGGNSQSAEYDYEVSDPTLLPPTISNVSINPANPTADDNVIVSGSVSDDDGTIETVVLKWKVDGGTFTGVNMNLSGDKYYGQIPKQTAGTTINYTVVATDNDSQQATQDGIYTVSQTNGITDNTNQKLKLYPNPVKNILNISIQDFTGSIDIKIYDILGKMVYKEKLQIANTNSIKLDGLDSGIYFINFEIDNKLITKQIIFDK